MSSGIVIYMRHVRNRPPFGAHLCARGAKAWFDDRNLDFRDFLEKGMPVEQAESYNDAFADRAAKAARAEHAAQQKGEL